MAVPKVEEAVVVPATVDAVVAQAAAAPAKAVEVHKDVKATASATTEVVTPSTDKASESSTTDKAPETSIAEKPVNTEAVKTEDGAGETSSDQEQDSSDATPVEPSIPEYKEESNLVSDLKDSEKKALEEFRLRIEKAIHNSEFKIVKKVVKAPKAIELQSRKPPVIAPIEAEKEEVRPISSVETPVAETSATSGIDTPADVEEKGKEAPSAEAVKVDDKAQTVAEKIEAKVEPAVAEKKVEAAVAPVVFEKKVEAATPPVVADKKVEAKVAPVIAEKKSEAATPPIVADKKVEAKAAPVVAEKKVEAKAAPVVAEKKVEAKAVPVVAEKKVEAKSAPVITEKKVEVKAAPVVPEKKVEAKAAPVVPEKKVEAKAAPVVPEKKVEAKVSPTVAENSKKVEAKVVGAVPEKKAEAKVSPAVAGKKVDAKVAPVVLEKKVEAKVLPAVAEKKVETKVAPIAAESSKKVEVKAAPGVAETKVEVKVSPVVAEKVEAKAASAVLEKLEAKVAPVVAEKVESKITPVVAEKIEEKVAPVTAEKLEENTTVIVNDKVDDLLPKTTTDGETKFVGIANVVEGVVAKVPDTEAVDAEVEYELEDGTPAEDISLWGVPLLYTKGDKRTDVVLLKFLRAREFNVKDAFSQLRKTIIWRKTFKADNLLQEEFAPELDGVAYMHGQTKEGHPVCYNVYGSFQDKELYQKTFGDSAKFTNFLRWRVQVLEKGIQLLNFTPEGPSAMVQITDLKNAPGAVSAKRDLRAAANQAVSLLQDNYPELSSKRVFINAPRYFSAMYAVISPLLSKRTKSKFVVAPAGQNTECLLRFISADNIPIQYGGLSRVNDADFEGVSAPVHDLVLKGGKSLPVEIPVTEVGSTVVWDLTVLGYDVTYGAEFVPSKEGAYITLIEKVRKLPATTAEPVRNSFKVTTPGKIVLTIENLSRKKKTVIYRYMIKKVTTSTESS